MNRSILKYPLKPWVINQKFGDNQACVQNGSQPVSNRKVIGKIKGVCPIGYSELYPQLGMKGHTGIDCSAKHAQALYSASQGIVEEIQTEVERGLGIGIITEEKYWFPDGDYNLKVRYWHLKSIDVKYGDKVSYGDFLGTCDNTGISAGDHLHFELKRVKKNSAGLWYNVDQDNGYFGSINPLPYFDGTYAVDVRIKLFTTVLDLSRKLLDLLNRKK